MTALTFLLQTAAAEGLTPAGIAFLAVCWGLCIVVMVASFYKIMKLGNKIEE